MGIKVLLDFAQSMIKKILGDLDIEAYMDDLGLWSKVLLDDHIMIVDNVLERVADVGMKCNLLKCQWAVKETSFLRHHMTPERMTQMRNKIDAFLKMGRPTNQTKIRLFIGTVTFYKSMWPRHSHVLVPLYELKGILGRFVWGPRQEQAFLTMKAMVAPDVMSYYLDLKELFEIYTDASNYQMGAAIIQDGYPVAYWSKKLSDTQKGYNTTEKELLAVVMYMQEYHNILYGGVINVYTNHKNLTFNNLSAPRVMRCKIFLEQYSINLIYVTGKTKVFADCFLRLPRMDGPSPGKNERKGMMLDFKTLVVSKDEEDVFMSTGEEGLTLLPTANSV